MIPYLFHLTANNIPLSPCIHNFLTLTMSTAFPGIIYIYISVVLNPERIINVVIQYHAMPQVQTQYDYADS